METKQVAELIADVLSGKSSIKAEITLHENQLVLELGHNQRFLVVVQDVSSSNNNERITCSKAGEVGHFQCGMCGVHNVPRFECKCIAIKEKENGKKAS